MQKILIVGCGDIGLKLASLLADSAEVYGLRRHIEGLPPEIKPIQADVTELKTLEGLAAIAFDAVVMTLTPGEASDQRYQQVYVKGTENVLQSLDHKALRRLIFVSSTSVYGQSNDEWVDESSATAPKRYSGLRLLEAEALCLAFASKFNIATAIIRFAGIYGPGRLRLINDVLAGKGSAPNYSNRIHRDDCAGFIQHLLSLEPQQLRSHYIGVDDQPVKLNEVKDWLAEQLACEKPIISDTGSRRGAKRCANKALKESGYQLIYSNYQQGYSAVLADLNYTQTHS